MDRRTFTLQLHDGAQPFVPGTSKRATPAPSWRCSGCLMAWGVYGPTTPQGRPQGDGCPLCKDKAWMSDNLLAHEIDEHAGIDSRSRMDAVHIAAPYAMAAVEQVITNGKYVRLTYSIQSILGDQVRKQVTNTMDTWIAQNRIGQILRGVDISFHDQVAQLTAMTVVVRIGHPVDLHPDRFAVRYRWVQ